ncbi:hypothetical protein J25TS5_36890 [Paenibacillus faecis]|nr:hypothetical protein J25TS5_36890 [Paenibacillus faecis]
MYNEQGTLLTDFQDADDYWYDVGCLTAEKIINSTNLSEYRG